MMGIKRTVQFSNQMVGGRLGKGGGYSHFLSYWAEIFSEGLILVKFSEMENLVYNFIQVTLMNTPTTNQVVHFMFLTYDTCVYPNFYKESIEMGPICQIQETNNNFENLNLVVPTSRVFSFTTLMYETCFNLNSP